MKKMLTAILSLIISSYAFAGNNYDWTLDDTSSLADELVFPMTFKVTPDKAGFYFAYNMGTEAGHGVMYTGFQPSTPSKHHPGKHMFHLVFSNFFDTDAVFDPNYCHKGADGGHGVTCSVYYPLDINKKYAMKISAKIEGDDSTYTGTLIDYDSGNELSKVGSFTVSTKDFGGLIKPKYNGFIEKYIDAGCSQNITAIQHGIIGRINEKEVKGYTYNYKLNPDPCFKISVSPTGNNRDQEIVINPSYKK